MNRSNAAVLPQIGSCLHWVPLVFHSILSLRFAFFSSGEKGRQSP
jgi:hypothetical protein